MGVDRVVTHSDAASAAAPTVSKNRKRWKPSKGDALPNGRKEKKKKK